MAWNKNWKLQFYLICVLFNISTAVERSAIHKKIQYHLEELNKGLQELRESNGHIINKRSVLNHDEIIYNSLLVFCNEMNSGGGSWSSTNAKPNQTTSSSSTSANKTSGYSLKSLAVPDHKKAYISEVTPVSTWPHLFPRKIQAERDGSNVWLVFDVIHTAAVYVTRYYLFDTPNTVIDYPENLLSSSLSPSSSQVTSSPSPIISSVRLRVDASQCVNTSNPADSQIASIGFTLVGNTMYHVTTNIDVCKFDYYFNETETDESREWVKKKEKIISEHLHLPYFKITPSDPGHEILIQRGQDVELYLDIHFKTGTYMSFLIRIWDRRNKTKILKAISILRYYDQSVVMDPKKNDLMSLEILEQSKLGNKSNDNVHSNDKEDKYRAKIKITVNISNGKRTGKLSISYTNRLNFNSRKIVESMSFQREILLKLPNRGNVLPKNQVEITNAHDIFMCDKNGMRRYHKTGKNCTVLCYADGTNIKDIFISDTNSRRSPPVKSVSQVFGDGSSAYAMIDVGPASKHIEGTYRCTAITNNGKQRRQDVKLFTSLFTTVDYQNFSVTELNNDTSKVMCTAFGAQPLNMSISIQNDEEMDERVDNKSINFRSISIDGNLSTLTLFLSTDQLRYPALYLGCRANGERGSDYSSMSLGGQISNQNPLIPKINIMPNASSIMFYGNGTAQLRCTANGGKPMEMWLTYGGNAENHRIDNKPENIRTTEETPGGIVLTVIVSENSVTGPTSWIDCRASNRYGEDWYDMNIYDWRHK